MTVNPSGWRPSAPANEQGEAQTVTGNRALMLEEPLLFEIGSTEQTGVDFPEFKQNAGRLGGLERNREIGLAGLSEPEAFAIELAKINWGGETKVEVVGMTTDGRTGYYQVSFEHHRMSVPLTVHRGEQTEC